MNTFKSFKYVISLWLLMFLLFMAFIYPQGHLKKLEYSNRNKIITAQDTPIEMDLFNLTSKKSHKPSVCERYKQEIQLVRRVITHVLGDRDSSGDVVCLLTQASYSRMDRIRKIAQHWKGPVSASIYVEEDSIDHAKGNLSQWFNRMNRTNIAIHFIVAKGEFYPVNFLRNVASNNTLAKYVFMIDADFLPNANLFQNILKLVRKGFFNDSKKALVVPAFEIVNRKIVFPASKGDVVGLYKKEILRPFHVKLYEVGHGSTKSSVWIKSNKMYRVQYQLHYEPYVVIQRAGAPLYNERFLHRFFNKISHIYELNHRGWTFYVMPDGYLVHMPHKSKMGSSWFMRRCALAEWYSLQKRLNGSEPMSEKSPQL